MRVLTMIIDPATLPIVARCKGCDAPMRARLGEPGTRIMWHPPPLCSHLLSKLASMGLELPDPTGGYAFSDGKRQ